MVEVAEVEVTEIVDSAGDVVAEVVAVEVPDQPGGLSGILDVLDKSSVNVEYMYAFVERCGGNAVIIFRFDDPESAIRVLTGKGIAILEGERLYRM